MGTTAYGGKGSKGRAANGDRPVGAANCRRDHHTMASCQNPPQKGALGEPRDGVGGGTEELPGRPGTGHMPHRCVATPRAGLPGTRIPGYPRILSIPPIYPSGHPILSFCRGNQCEGLRPLEIWGKWDSGTWLSRRFSLLFSLILLPNFSATCRGCSYHFYHDLMMNPHPPNFPPTSPSSPQLPPVPPLSPLFPMLPRRFGGLGVFRVGYQGALHVWRSEAADPLTNGEAPPHSLSPTPALQCHRFQANVCEAGHFSVDAGHRNGRGPLQGEGGGFGTGNTWNRHNHLEEGVLDQAQV